MDNILIFSRTLEEHSGIVKEILKILSDNKLSIQTKKCHFHQTKIDYLGVIISKNSVEVNSIKIKGVAEWPEPKEKWEVWQFLGFCNFYRCLIRGFAKVSKPDRANREEGVKMGDRRKKCLQETKKIDGIYSHSRNTQCWPQAMYGSWCFGVCHRRSLVSTTTWRVIETHLIYFPITKRDREKLWDLWSWVASSNDRAKAMASIPHGNKASWDLDWP